MVEWQCPICGNQNQNSIYDAKINSCVCSSCGTECVVDFDIDITVNNVEAV